MNFISIFILLVIILYSFFKKKWKIGCFIIILSLTSTMLFIQLNDVRILIIHILSLLSLVFTFTLFKKKDIYIFSGLYYEQLLLIALSIIYVFIFPWESNTLILSQKPLGKSIISLSRFFMELSIINVFAYLIKYKKVTINNLLNQLSIILIIICTVAVLDKFLLNYRILKFFFNGEYLNWDLLTSRILGFSNEPRIFGRLVVFSWFILFYFYKMNYKIKFIKFTLFYSFIIIALTLSLSTYLLFLIIMVASKLYDIKNKRKLFIYFIFIFTTLFILNKKVQEFTNQYETGTNLYWLVYKIQLLNSGGIEIKQNINEPILFTSFEIFDRIALNHLYNDTKSLIFGTGPNLISIPASKYIDKSGQEIFGDSVNMIPGIGLINLISRSGLFGFCLFLFTYFKIKRTLKFKNLIYLNKLNFLNFLSFFLIITPFFYFINGIILGIIFLKNDNNYYPSIKWKKVSN